MFETPSVHEATVHPADHGDRATVPACWRVLDEIDYGLLMLSHGGAVLHVNHLARFELASERCLLVQDGVLTGRTALHREELVRGLVAARAGRRVMLAFDMADATLTAVCMPLGSPFDTDEGPLLLMLERNRDDNLALTFYARNHNITHAEESVLRCLCEGLDVSAIADRLHIAESTVRSHIRSLREKTRTSSMRQLVQTVADLPPMVSALRQGATPARNGQRYTAAAHACPNLPSPITCDNSPAAASSGVSVPAYC